MSSGKKGQMIVKKRSSQKEKRKTGSKPPLPRAKDQGWQETDPPNSNGKLSEENGIKDLVLMGDEVGDPDISMLVQQENEILEDEPIDLKNPEVAAEVSEDDEHARDDAEGIECGDQDGRASFPEN